MGGLTLGTSCRHSCFHDLRSRLLLGASSLLLLSTVSCSTARNNAEVTASVLESGSHGASLPAQVPVPDAISPSDLQHSASWNQYQSGLQALENSDWLEAQYYFDLALDELVAEVSDSTRSLGPDYYTSMSLNILHGLESVYPHLAELGSVDSTMAMATDLDAIEQLDTDENLDMAEIQEIESFLDTLDLSRFSLPVTLNDRVMKEIHFLTKGVRKFTEGSLSRQTMYQDMIKNKLRERGMPEDLLYLSFVESGFKISAYSRAKAAGLWQFIPGTGRHFGLPIDSWVDMRRHPERSTDAALDYLSALYKEFGDWQLAMAAYNCGEGRIRRLLRDKPDSVSVSYWDLPLPRETMHYVPRILAAMIIGHFPEHYGFNVEVQSTIPFDTVTVEGVLPLENAAQAAGVGVNTIRDLNMELSRWSTPPNAKTYTLRIPEGTRDQFLEAYSKMDRSKFAVYQQYKVRSRDNLGSIARRFGLSVADIRQSNGLKKKSRLKVGQILILPIPAGAVSSTSLAGQNNDDEAPVVASSKTYTVRRGDNLGAIARRFGLSVAELKAWNGLSDSRIRKGQRLNLRSPQRRGSSAQAAESRTVKSDVVASGESYTVKQGDTFYSIANAQGVDMAALMDLNGANDGKLKLGQQLKLPAGNVRVAEAAVSRPTNLATDAKAGSYEVRSGDNLYSIARRLGVSLDDLKRWNNLGTTTDLRPGQKLVVKDSVANKSAASGAKSRTSASYVVRNGDNLWDIARRHNVSVQQLTDWNNLREKKLQPGMRLKVGP